MISRILSARFRTIGPQTSISLQEYARLDLVSRHLPSVISASVHYYNTDEEIESFCEALNPEWRDFYKEICS